MTSIANALREVSNAATPSDVEHVLRRLGVVHLFWQTKDSENLYTWERVPAGFFSMYYGLDSDSHCAIANALRRGWVCFTFGQARKALGGSKNARDAAQIWTNFDMPDGLCVVQGYGESTSLLVAAVKDGAERLLEQYQPLFAAAAARLDMILRDRKELLYIASRKRNLLSPAERAVVQAQIDYPHFTVREQADLLGISPRTLQRRHGDIAKKLGVSTFPGAIVVALGQSEEPHGFDRARLSESPEPGSSTSSNTGSSGKVA